MSADPAGGFGFNHPGRMARFQCRRSAGHAELVAGVALVLSILVAAAAVGVGVAHAHALQGGSEETARFAVAVLVGLLLVGMGGFTALVTSGRNETPRRD